MAEIALNDLTENTIDGAGAFDVLMKATKEHLEGEFKAGRIKGPEYSTVYLGAIQSVMTQALQFILSKQRADKEAELLNAQILTEGVNRQVAQQQLTNLVAEKAGIDARTALTNQEAVNLAAEKLHIDSKTSLTEQQESNLVTENAYTAAQTTMVGQQVLNLTSDKILTDAKVTLTNQQVTNAVTEETVLSAQECKLKAEFDQLVESRLKTIAETALLAQKKVTEQAQTSGTGIDVDSVIGKQLSLYGAQTDGFVRDAEQKAAKLLVDSWNVRRTTDTETVADGTNLLNDVTIGRAITKLLDGVNA